MKNATRTSFLLSMFCIGLMDKQQLDYLCSLSKISKLPQVRFSIFSFRLPVVICVNLVLKQYFDNLGESSSCVTPVHAKVISSQTPAGDATRDEEKQEPRVEPVESIDLLTRYDPSSESFPRHLKSVLLQLEILVARLLLDVCGDLIDAPFSGGGTTGG